MFRSRATASPVGVRVLSYMAVPKELGGQAPKMNGNGGEAFPIGIRSLS